MNGIGCSERTGIGRSGGYISFRFSRFRSLRITYSTDLSGGGKVTAGWKASCRKEGRYAASFLRSQLFSQIRY